MAVRWNHFHHQHNRRKLRHVRPFTHAVKRHDANLNDTHGYLVLQLVLAEDSRMVVLGLISLQIASEELINPRENICTDRKLVIRQSFEAYIPKLFTVLHGEWYA